MTNDYENVTEKEVTEFGENTVTGIGNFAKLMKENKLTIAKQVKEIEELKKRIAELEKVESDSNNEHSTCLAEIERLNKELENAKSENKNLSKSLENAKTENKDLSELIDVANAERQKLMKDYKESNEKNTKLDSEIQELKNENLKLQTELNKYKNAISQLKFTNNQESAILKTMECYENL